MRIACALVVLLVLPGWARSEEGGRKPASALVAEALARREKGELWEAEELLRAAVEREPTASSLAELGTTSYLIAVRMVERGEGNAPGGGASIRSILLDAARALNRSLEMGESVRALVSRGMVKLYLGDQRGCRLDLDRALQVEPRSPLALLENGRDAFRQRDYEKAMSLFASLVSVVPGDAHARLWLGKSRYFGGKAEEAVGPLVEALRLDADLVEGYAYLRGLYLNRGRHVEMERALGRVLQACPDSPLALSNLGITLAEKGDHEPAVAVFNRLLAKDETNLDARCWVAWLYTFRLERLDDGLEQFRLVLAADPEHARARASLEYLMRRGVVEDRFAMALKVLTVWCEADPENARAQAYRGLALRRLGRYAEASEAYEAARAADPMQAWIVSDAGLVHMATGDHAAAERTFCEALEIDEEFLDALENLGILARLRGDHAAAHRRFSKALEVARETRPEVVGKFRRYLDLVIWRDR